MQMTGIEPDVLIAFGSLLVASIALIASAMRNFSSDEKSEQVISDRLDAIAESVKRLTAIVEGMDAKLDAHAESIARADEQVKSLTKRVDGIEGRLTALEHAHAVTSHKEAS